MAFRFSERNKGSSSFSQLDIPIRFPSQSFVHISCFFFSHIPRRYLFIQLLCICFYIRGLFDDAVSDSHYITSSDCVTVNTELERMWKEKVMS
jgi:hypothetical protein